MNGTCTGMIYFLYILLLFTFGCCTYFGHKNIDMCGFDRLQKHVSRCANYMMHICQQCGLTQWCNFVVTKDLYFWETQWFTDFVTRKLCCYGYSSIAAQNLPRPSLVYSKRMKSRAKSIMGCLGMCKGKVECRVNISICLIQFGTQPSCCEVPKGMSSDP